MSYFQTSLAHNFFKNDPNTQDPSSLCCMISLEDYNARHKGGILIRKMRIPELKLNGIRCSAWQTDRLSRLPQIDIHITPCNPPAYVDNKSALRLFHLVIHSRET